MDVALQIETAEIKDGQATVHWDRNEALAGGHGKRKGEAGN